MSTNQQKTTKGPLGWAPFGASLERSDRSARARRPVISILPASTPVAFGSCIEPALGLVAALDVPDAAPASGAFSITRRVTVDPISKG